MVVRDRLLYVVRGFLLQEIVHDLAQQRNSAGAQFCGV
jgi:hypothetical protein